MHDQWAVADGELFLKRDLVVGVRSVESDRYEELKRPVRGIWESQAAPLRIVEGGNRGDAYGTDPF